MSFFIWFEFIFWCDEGAASLHGLLILASAGLVTTFRKLLLSTTREICDILWNPYLGML
jgi:hypothetical protein